MEQPHGSYGMTGCGQIVSLQSYACILLSRLARRLCGGVRATWGVVCGVLLCSARSPLAVRGYTLQ